MKYQLEINYFLYLLKCAVADIVPKPAEKEINWKLFTNSPNFIR